MVRSLLILSLLSGGSCLRTTQFHCTGNTECSNGATAGICQPSGFCSFADPGCTSGQRYGGLSGDLAGQCVTGSPSDAAADAYPDAPAGFYRIGGTISGLRAPTLVLQNNGGDDYATATSGPFQFATPLASGTMYTVTVKTQPTNQTCAIGFASGTVGSADINSVGVNCTGDPGVFCGGSSYCTAGSQVCCNPGATGSCVASCTTKPLACDDTADCSSGMVCCAKITNQGVWQQSTCSTSCNSPSLEMCDPTASSPCIAVPGTACRQMTQLPTGYYSCQP